MIVMMAQLQPLLETAQKNEEIIENMAKERGRLQNEIDCLGYIIKCFSDRDQIYPIIVNSKEITNTLNITLSLTVQQLKVNLEKALGCSPIKDIKWIGKSIMGKD
jgi:hypothetical protein